MAFNPVKLMQFKDTWTKFTQRHPKIPAFFRAVGKHALEEGAVFEMTVTLTDGRVMRTNLSLGAEDIDAIRQITETLGSN